MLNHLNDPVTATAARMERKFLARYEGGCHLPIGGLAENKEDMWIFRGFISGVRSGRLVQDRVQDADPDICTRLLSESLHAQGADELLAELQS
jgi:hydroxymethylbilane synthase